MSLDTNGLQIIMKSGSLVQRAYARTIYPLRKRGNYLLCTILLGNVLVNNTLTILLDSIISGLFAILGATAAIVVFGEIMPKPFAPGTALPSVRVQFGLQRHLW